MAKIYTITTILLGVIFLLNLMGIATFSGSLYSAIMGADGQSPMSSTFFSKLNIIIFAAVGTMIIVGFPDDLSRIPVGFPQDSSRIPVGFL